MSSGRVTVDGAITSDTVRSSNAIQIRSSAMFALPKVHIS